MNQARAISAAPLDVSALDFSMLSDQDLANIVLQRSDVILDARQPGKAIRAWMDGDTKPIDAIVADKGKTLAQRAAQLIGEEFEALTGNLDAPPPSRIADIGCGYAFFDLFAYHRYGCDVLLIDIENNEHSHFGFEDEAAAYTSLGKAKEFLLANGVPSQKIATWNPEAEDVDAPEKVDVAVSFLSCGFHFPVDMYMPFFRFGIVPGGRLILDLRAQAFQESKRNLKALGQVEILTQGKGRKRVIVRKGRR